jgi:hypothetical protein
VQEFTSFGPIAQFGTSHNAMKEIQNSASKMKNIAPSVNFILSMINPTLHIAFYGIVESSGEIVFMHGY